MAGGVLYRASTKPSAQASTVYYDTTGMRYCASSHRIYRYVEGHVYYRVVGQLVFFNIRKQSFSLYHPPMVHNQELRIQKGSHKACKPQERNWTNS
jgi:ABC-type transport system involved in cytochrome bd biosynthesis fused ATPase/permease subunit